MKHTELHQCQNCSEVHTADKIITEIPHYHERVGEDEPEPSGECPSCGALCHPIETADDCGNQFGYVCPKCHRGDQLHITANICIELLPDGSQVCEDHGDHEWDENSPVSCGSCAWSGHVKQLDEIELAED